MKTIGEFPVGSRFAYRAKDDWRTAAISKIGEEKAKLTVCSPTGRTYRLWRPLETEIRIVNGIYVLMSEKEDQWTDNMTTYDKRW